MGWLLDNCMVIALELSFDNIEPLLVGIFVPSLLEFLQSLKPRLKFCLSQNYAQIRNFYKISNSILKFITKSLKF